MTRLRPVLCRARTWVLPWLCLLLAAPALAQVQFVDAADVDVPLAAGTSTTIRFALRNSGSTPLIAQFGVGPYTSPINVYSLQATGPCSVPTGFPFPLSGFAQVAAGAEVVCSYTLQRQANAFSDTVLVFTLEPQVGPAPARKLYRIGDLARVQATQAVERFPQPGLPGRVRVSVANHGPTAIAELLYATCTTFGAQDLNRTVRVVGGDCLQIGPGSCGTGTLETGFGFHGLPVGATRHCIVELTPPGTQSLLPLFLALSKSGGATLVNTEPAADLLVIRGIPIVPLALPAVSGTALLGLLLALVAAAGTGWRRR